MEEAKKPRPHLIVGIIIALVLAIGGTVAVLKIAGSDDNSAQNGQTGQQSQVETEADSTQEEGTTVRFTAEEGKTVLEQLQAQADVVVQESEYGAFVESINGVKSGEDGKYWLYYVNGEAATVGAGEYTTVGGEQIEWKFE